MRFKIRNLICACMACLFLLAAADRVLAAGSLSIAAPSEASSGETVEVTLYSVDDSGADIDADVSLIYDASQLEYVSSSDDNAVLGNGAVKTSGKNVSVKFKAIGSGKTHLRAEGASLTPAGTYINISGGTSQAGSSAAGSQAGSSAAGSQAGSVSGSISTPGSAPSDASAAKSGDNSLSSLKISKGILSPPFKSSTTEYTAEVGNDVSEIAVTPVLSNSKATIESITGHTSLKEGSNVISVKVKAENGNLATYKITVAKGGAPSSVPASAGASDMIPEKTEEESEAKPETPAGTTEDPIIIDGVTYHISEDFTDVTVPDGFSEADFKYKDKPYKGFSFDPGHLGIYYMVSDAGEKRFFVYDADRDGFYPYVRLTNGEHFIILMVVPNGAIPPAHYETATFEIEDGVSIPAYQYAGDPNKEVVVYKSPEEEAAFGGASDFYIFYAMDPSGVSGWYQYDVRQKIYQRFNGDLLSSEDDGKNYNTLLSSYSELSDRHKTAKERDRKLIAVLIFLSALFLIVILNLLLKIREIKRDGFEPSKKARPEKKTYVVKEEEEEEDSNFYEEDGKDIITEFEEKPSVSGRRQRKKSAKGKEERDIEFWDLNDL